MSIDPAPAPNAALLVKSCSDSEFDEVKLFIQRFDLDDRDLHQDQFVTLGDGKGLLGFGRVREHDGCSELCSLGVIEHHRTKGIGKQLMEAMMEKATQAMYLVCVIPSYFEDFGFSICEHYPPEIQDKLRYCVGSLPVDEKYVVMRKL